MSRSNDYSWQAETAPLEDQLRTKFRVCLVTGISFEDYDSLTPYETNILIEEFKKLNKNK